MKGKNGLTKIMIVIIIAVKQTFFCLLFKIPFYISNLAERCKIMKKKLIGFSVLKPTKRIFQVCDFINNFFYLNYFCCLLTI